MLYQIWLSAKYLLFSNPVACATDLTRTKWICCELDLQSHPLMPIHDKHKMLPVDLLYPTDFSKHSDVLHSIRMGGNLAVR